MSQEKVDYAVIIGRFQPYHLGHRSLIQQAKVLARKKVIILIGSATTPRSIKNPFTYAERVSMIAHDNYVSSSLVPIKFEPIEDYKYNNLQWIQEVQSKVQYEIGLDGWTDYPPTVGLVGLDKDKSTEYLKWFPQWKMIDVPQLGEGSKFDATAIRDILFGDLNIEFVRGVLPESTMSFVEEFENSKEFVNLVKEYEFIKKYKTAWASAPYAPTFVTVDAVVFQAGHVLMIRRGAEPGKGLWALPGGFVNQDERLEDGCIRELREETGLKVPDPVLRGSIFARDVFDHPDRSLRGRTITHAYGIRLNSIGELPKVKGSDDADKAKWVSLNDLRRDEIFEDHYDIINAMVGKV